jgi:hypothetical protein
MSAGRCIRSGVKWVAAGVGLAAASYAAWAGLAWSRYGHPRWPSDADGADVLLDRFMPDYDVAERHHTRVAAPADVTFAAAVEMDLEQSRTIRAIFRARELVMRAHADATARPRAFLAQMKTLGWGIVAEVPGREIVMGAVTQPWKADVVFRALPPGDFSRFDQPDYVKIVWTLRADPIGSGESVFRTETRAVTTDPGARAKFRRYWSLASPGILLIRRVSLGLVKAEAERRVRPAAARRRAGEPLAAAGPLPTPRQAASSTRRT